MLRRDTAWRAIPRQRKPSRRASYAGRSEIVPGTRTCSASTGHSSSCGGRRSCPAARDGVATATFRRPGALVLAARVHRAQPTPAPEDQARAHADHQHERGDEEGRRVSERVGAGERLGDEGPDGVGQIPYRLPDEMAAPEIAGPAGGVEQRGRLGDRDGEGQQDAGDDGGQRHGQADAHGHRPVSEAQRVARLAQVGRHLANRHLARPADVGQRDDGERDAAGRHREPPPEPDHQGDVAEVADHDRRDADQDLGQETNRRGQAPVVEQREVDSCRDPQRNGQDHGTEGEDHGALDGVEKPAARPLRDVGDDAERERGETAPAHGGQDPRQGAAEEEEGEGARAPAEPVEEATPEEAAPGGRDDGGGERDGHQATPAVWRRS